MILYFIFVLFRKLFDFGAPVLPVEEVRRDKKKDFEVIYLGRWLISLVPSDAEVLDVDCFVGDQ